MKKEKKVAVVKVAGTPTDRGRHKHSASSWNRHKSFVGGESQVILHHFLFRIRPFCEIWIILIYNSSYEKVLEAGN